MMMTARNICRERGGHDLPPAPSIFNAEAYAAWVGEGRTDVCGRCGIVRISHPAGRRSYRVPDDETEMWF